MTRLALLTEIPAPYRIPLFNTLAERLELTVLFLAASNPERPYRLHEDELRFRYEILPGRDVVLRGRWLVLNRGVAAALERARPQVVLAGGWNQPAFWRALRWSRRRHLPVLLWVESTGRDRRGRGLEWTKRTMLHRADAVVVPGRASSEYLRALGVEAKRVVIAPNAVDPAIFERPEAPPRGGDGSCRVLAVGRLAPEKGIDVLLRAAGGLPVEVVVVGSGAEESRLRALAGADVRFLGHVERDELPGLYAQADVFALPSRSEPWGMALNEAALAGLPLVATDAAGAAHDLIEDGVNGFRVPADDVEALRTALGRLAGDPELRARMGERSRERGLMLTPEAWANAVAEAATMLANGCARSSQREGK